MTYTLSWTYRGIILAVSVFVLFRYRKLETASKIICLLIWLGLLTETVGWFGAKYYHNNYPVFNVSFYFEFLLICLYFNYSIASLKKRNIGIYIATAGILVAIVNTIFLQPFMHILNSNFLFLECLVVVCLALYSIYTMVKIDDDNVQLQRRVNFWLSCILLFYQCSTLWSWGLYDSYGVNDKETAKALDQAVLTLNIITYLSYATLFYFNPKPKALYV